MPVQDTEILKKLLLQEEPEQETLPQGFEDDPMGFILKKYLGLNTVMEYMMTKDFREFVDAIFVIAPKPTTFKVLLHNGQYFFLQFMGKTYQATVLGKNYYLMSIGEKERCMLAIARLLRYGSPLKTKGPEGGEQGTRPEGETGGEGGEGGGGGESTPEVPPAETSGEEGGETLEERKVLAEILKKSLFENKNTLSKTIKKGFDDENLAGGPESKRGPHLRYQIGTQEETDNLIKKILDSVPGEEYYEIEVVSPNDFSNGAKSGTYNTYKVTVTGDNESFKKGEQAFVVNQKTSKITITPKSLSPANLGLSGKVYKSHSQLTSDLVGKVREKIKDKPTADLLVALTELVDKNIQEEYEDASKIKDHEKIIKIDSNTESLMRDFSEQDLNIVGKDYGEELGALATLKSIKKVVEGLTFPKGNNALEDFEVDGYRVSSKYKGGSSSTLTKVIKNYDEKLLTTEKEKEVFSILKNVADKGVSEGYIYVANLLDSPAISKLAEIMSLADAKEITTRDIQRYIEKMRSEKNEDFDSSFTSAFEPFYKIMNRYPKKKKVDWQAIEKGKDYGAIIGPLSYHVADLMNEKEGYKDALVSIMSKVEVKQMYLDIQVNKKQLKFELQSFSDPNAKFIFSIGSQSVYNPENSRLAFKLQ